MLPLIHEKVVWTTREIDLHTQRSDMNLQYCEACGSRDAVFSVEADTVVLNLFCFMDH